MFLKTVDVKGFRGISELFLDVNKDGSVLIGENAWGKSSLLSALMFLSPEQMFNQFVSEDFHHNSHKHNTLSITFTFCGEYQNQLNEPVYQALQPVVYLNRSDKLQYLVYQIRAEQKEGKIVVDYRFLNEYGDSLFVEDVKTMMTALVKLRPVLRLKDPGDKQFLGDPVNNHSIHVDPRSDKHLDLLKQQLLKYSPNLRPEELSRGLDAACYLLEYYLVDQKKRYNIKHVDKRETPNLVDWNHLDQVNHILSRFDDTAIRSTLLSVFTALLVLNNPHQFSPDVVPILLLEEPESQLHPRILSIGIRFLNHLPMQKIATTNSSDLISLIPLEKIYRLVRLPDRIAVYHFEPRALSVSDTRKIMFHLLYRRPTTLFARSWLLVEGETEIWMLNELANLCGYHLDSEGIQLIEFAQCGLKPLIKLANKIGIEWFVVTDGDIAGKHYSETVNSLAPNREHIEDYLLTLPAQNIENFMFRYGFSHVYKQIAYGSTEHVNLPVSRIIQKAIQRSSKPDLAIAICDDAKQRGVESVPPILRNMFGRLVKSAKTIY